METTLQQADSAMIRPKFKYFQYAYFFRLLIERDLKERYAGSWMGLSWGIIQPAAQFAVYVVVFSVILKVSPGSAYAGIPFAAWLLTGMAPWLVIAEVLARCPNEVVSHGALVTNHPFPYEILPMVTLSSAMVNHLIALGLLACVLPLAGVAASWSLAWLPLWCLALAVFGLGLALLSSALGVYFRDFVQLAQVLSLVWNFATPIAYPQSMVPQAWSWILRYNPICLPVRAYRAALLGREASSWHDLALFGAWALGLALLGSITFRKLKGGFADVL